MSLPYEDQTSTYTVLPFLFILLLSASSAYFLFNLIIAHNAGLLAFAVWIVISLISLLVLTNFVHLSVRVERKNIRVSWGIFGKSIPIADITTVKLKKTDKGEFLTHGFRFNHRGELGFLAKSGRAVEIRLKSGKSYLVSSDKPEDLFNIINQTKRLA